MASEPFLINPHRSGKHRRRRRARKNLALGILNPRRRRKSTHRRKSHRRTVRRRVHGNRRPRVIRRRRVIRRNNVARHRRHHRRHRSNPLLPSVKSLTSDVKEAAALAGGLIGVTLATNLLPLPVFLKTGWIRLATKAGVGIGLGALVGSVASRNLGKLVTLGALAGVVVDVVNQVTGGMSAAPSGAGVSDGGVGEFPAYDGYEHLDHYTGMGHFTGFESGLALYGQYV